MLGVVSFASSIRRGHPIRQWPGVAAPSARPLEPQPDAAKFVAIDRIVAEKPLTEVLELLASDLRVGV